MSDTIITSDAPASGTAETATPVQSTGTENAAPETQATDNGSPQGRTEGSDQDTGTGRKRWSMQDEVKELRAQRRELREQVSRFEEVRNELAQLREEMNRRNQPKDQKDPSKFWQDPEASINATLDERLERLQESMFEKFQTSREQEYAQQAFRQETESATEFIRNQPGYHSEDDEDLIEIIKENQLATLGPTRAARIAWTLLQQNRGVGDRTLAKQRASGVQGQPPGQGFGRKMWARAEFDAAVDQLERDPHNPKNVELLRELEAAHKDGRVK